MSVPFVLDLYSSKMSRALSYGKSFSKPSCRAVSVTIRQSGFAWPGGSRTLRAYEILRSEFVIVPSRSDHCAAGSTTCAYWVVSVGK